MKLKSTTVLDSPMNGWIDSFPIDRTSANQFVLFFIVVKLRRYSRPLAWKTATSRLKWIGSASSGLLAAELELPKSSRFNTESSLIVNQATEVDSMKEPSS